MNKRIKFIFFLMACLMPLAMVAQQTHWTPQGAAYEDNMTLTGVIQINGVEQQSAALEVGAFCGTECRGAVRAVLFPATQRYVVMLTIFGNNGDQITFKLYDHNQGMELNYQSPPAVTFGSNGLGTLMNPYVLNFTSSDYTISASASPSSGGTISGAGTYPGGSTCTLTATPATGYSFVRWTKNGSQVSTNPSYSFTVTGNASYVAVFSLNSYTISASSSPSAGGSVSGAGSYNYGSTCTLTATPATGYSFVRWTKNASQVSTNPSYSFTVTGNASYVAVFSLNSYTISASSSPSAGGSVSGAGSYNYGSTCTLTATPATGYSFVRWTKNGTQVSTNASYSFTVTEAASYVAVFEAENIIVFADPNVKAICVANWDTNGSGELSYAEAAAVTSLGEVFSGDTTITSFEELQYFTGLSAISAYAFSDCSNLTGSLYIPNSVTSIGNYAFYNCSGLTGPLNIPNYVTYMGHHAFYNCSGFTGTLTIPNSITSIGYYAFGYCSGFTGSLTIPNSVTSIESYAFWYCSGFTGSLTIPNSVTSIGEATFGYCSGFTGSLTIPNSVTSIGRWAFAFCSGFTGSLTIPNSVTSIGDLTFGYCSGFTGTLTIPNPVTSIGNSAFYSCGGFTSMNILPETPPTLGNNAFDGVPKSIPVSVPCASIASYQEAEGWSEFTNYHGIDCPSCIISATANPAEGGTIEGAGSYEEGAICTLTATAAEGYTFVNWTENGEVVSTETSYSFTVTEDRDLVANFMQASPSIPTLGMIAYYPFNGNANDESGYGNHGILQGSAPQLTTDRFGNENSAYLFGGYNNKGWIKVPNSNSLQLNNSMTISFWMTLNGYDGMNGWGSYVDNGNFAIICKDGDNSGFNTCLNRHEDGRLNIHSFNSNGCYDINTYQDYQLGQWMHCVVTIENTVSKLYINGMLQQDSIKNQADFSNANNRDMYIGIMYGFWYPFNGKIDDIILYNRALTPQEVIRLYNYGEGNLPGVFSVSENTQVNFSQGNLQYQASTNTWRFAENQWEYLGDANSNISEIYDGWIDLFCWGTSGYNHGANNYQPWSTSQINRNYYAYGDANYNLFDQTGKADWGYNPIQNGGNQENSGWRTMTNEEWIYLLETRNTPSGIRYAKAQVNGINGLLILPDDWNTSIYSLSNANSGNASYSSNMISSSDWMNILEPASVVFLPENGFRCGTYWYGGRGDYWSSSHYDETHACGLLFEENSFSLNTEHNRYDGKSVRLVRFAQNYFFGINAIPNPSEGGTIEGAGTYEACSTCTLTATANTSYTFVHWTENGEVVSTESTYSFIVTRERNLEAFFSPPFNITALANPSEDGTVSFNTDFENQQIPSNWTNDATYPWVVTTPEYAGYNGSFCMMSGNGGVHSSTSSIEVTVDFIQDGSISFIAGCWGEGSSTIWDKCRFYIDDIEQFNYGAQQSWNSYYYELPVGTHTFRWSYSKDGSVHSTGDAFFVDDVKFTGAGIGNQFNYGQTCTLTATPNEGYLFLNWNRNGEVLSCNANYSFTVTEPIALEAVFMPLNGRLVGAGEATNQYLPSYSYFCYTLSQQIYTPDEIGAAGSILTISYFNAGETKTRSYDIYMVHTDKNTFENNTDWITVTEADRVFSGEVTMTRGYWNTILLDVPFDYDGTSNLAIIVDDNSGNWSSNHMYCRVFNANGSQAIRVYSDGTNYDPYNPSGYGGTLHSVKNQMIFGVMPAYHFVTAGTWGNAANWSGGALPGADDAVFIDANCALNRDAEVAMLAIAPGNTLTLRPGKTLSVTGNLFNTAIEGLVVEDGAQFVSTSYNVAATVKKNVQAFNNSNPDGWYTISSPMNGMVIEGSNFLTPGYDLYRFNETNLTHDEWENYKANLADFTIFEKGRGYLYANSNTFASAFTGILNNMDVTYTLTCTERPNDPLSGFNLIGNPFPHEIYKGAGGAINNVNLASGYYTLTNEGTWEVHSFDDAIQPGQGFLVKATAPTVLTIAKSNEVAFSESGDAKKGVTERMCISVAGDNGQDRTYVYFGQGVGLDKKNDFDAQVPNLWIRDNGHDYAIAHVEDTDESLELCFSNRQEGDFTLAITTSDMEFEYLQLIDRAAGVTVDLLKQSVYTFHSERNEGTKRFTLAFKKK